MLTTHFTKKESTLSIKISIEDLRMKLIRLEKCQSILHWY